MILVIQKQVNQFTVQKQAVLRVRVAEFNIPSGITNSNFTAKGEVIVGTGPGTYLVLPPGADGEYWQYDSSEPGGVKSGLPTLEVEDATNYAINGGFDFAQRTTPGTLTAIADGGYGPDRWKSYRENADLQYQRVSGSGVSGITSAYYGEYKKITNGGKILVCQPLEYLETVRFRGRTVSFQLKMRSNVARTMKMAIIELQAAGVADTIPAVVSAYNADSTDPTLGANLAVIATPVSCAVTTNFQTFSFSAAVPSTSKNLLLAVWSDADLAVNDTLGMAEAGFYYGDTLRSWTPRIYTDEFLLCQRYYWKTFPIDTPPASNTSANNLTFIANKAGATANGVYFSMILPVILRTASPTMTSYNPSAANAQVRDLSFGDCSAVSVTTDGTLLTISATGHASTLIGSRCRVGVSIDAEL